MRSACACDGGQPATAAYLLTQGADYNWVGHDHLTRLDAARRSGATEVVTWLRALGGRSATARVVPGSRRLLNTLSKITQHVE